MSKLVTYVLPFVTLNFVASFHLHGNNRRFTVIKYLEVKERFKCIPKINEDDLSYPNDNPTTFFEWCEQTFHNLEPVRIITHPNEFKLTTLDLPGCIIDEPKERMAIPILDFDPSFWSKEMLKYSKIKAGPRAKPLMATVRGMGGGKTRSFEEIRRRLLHEEGVLVLAITFNMYWDVGSGKDSWPDTKSSGKSFILSVLSRMASMFLGLSLEKICRRIRSSDLDTLNRLESTEIIQGFVLWMVQKVQRHRKISTFALLVDEIVHMENYLKKRFPESGDETTVLCEALLTYPIPLTSEQRLHTALAISSLEIGPIGQTTSGRDICAIVLPARLNQRSVTKFFCSAVKSTRPKKKAVTKIEKFRLRLIAVTVNNIPRLVEMVETFTILNGNVPVNAIYITDLYKYLYEDIGVRYGYSSAPPPDHILSAIIFGDPLSLSNAGVQRAIVNSVLTNSLETFNKDQLIPQPEASILRLMTVTSKSYTPFPCAIYEGLSAILTSIEKVKNVHNVGSLLEVVVFEWLTIRLTAACETNVVKNFSLMRLFGLQSIADIPVELVSRFVTPFPDIFFATIQEISFDVNSWLGQHNVIKSMLESVTMSDKYPDFVIIRPAAGEAWDIALKVCNPGFDEPFYIFIDVRSAKETDTKKNDSEGEVKQTWGDWSVSDLPKEGSQYKQAVKVMDGNKNFVYIYLSYHSGRESFWFDNCMFLGREDTLAFFGQLADLYIALCE